MLCGLPHSTNVQQVIKPSSLGQREGSHWHIGGSWQQPQSPDCSKGLQGFNLSVRSRILQGASGSCSGTPTTTSQPSLGDQGLCSAGTNSSVASVCWHSPSAGSLSAISLQATETGKILNPVPGCLVEKHEMALPGRSAPDPSRVSPKFPMLNGEWGGAWQCCPLNPQGLQPEISFGNIATSWPQPSPARGRSSTSIKLFRRSFSGAYLPMHSRKGPGKATETVGSLHRPASPLAGPFPAGLV